MHRIHTNSGMEPHQEGSWGISGSLWDALLWAELLLSQTSLSLQAVHIFSGTVMDRVNACRKRFSGLLVMCKLASGQLPQREMANKYLLVVSKNHSHKTLPFGCRSVCVFTETNAKGDGFISD